MRILLLTKYGPLGASSRLRSMQYVPAFRALGWQTEIQSLLPDSYLKALYAKRSVALHAIAAYIGRVWFLLTNRAYDVIWIEKEAFPWLPFFIEKLLLPKRPAIVVDYDDAMFHQYDRHPNRWIRRCLGRKIDDVMRHADIVTVGNDYLGERASHAGCKRVEYIPTVVDLQRYKTKSDADFSRIPVVGWIGSPETVRLLAPYFDLFSRIQKQRPIRLVAIGARPDQLKGSGFESAEWSEVNEADLVRSFDIGIMPLQDTPWQRGKCGYKLIQYMACGLPVVASNVGVNSRIVDHERSGFLVSNDVQWEKAIGALLDSRGLRVSMGSEGRTRVEQEFNVDVTAPRLIQILNGLVKIQ